MRIFRIDQSDPDPEKITEVVEILRSGGVIAFPTDTFYGLGADIYNDAAVKRIFDIKGREADKPILILISTKGEVASLVSPEKTPAFAYQLIDKFWPGPLTVVFPASEAVSGILTGSKGKIGIRLPAHVLCVRLIEKLGGPITATSANVSSRPSLDNPSDVLQAIGDKIDALIDGGLTRGGKESTVVDVTGTEPSVLREGAIPASIIRKNFRFQISNLK